MNSLLSFNVLYQLQGTTPVVMLYEHDTVIDANLDLRPLPVQRNRGCRKGANAAIKFAYQGASEHHRSLREGLSIAVNVGCQYRCRPARHVAAYLLSSIGAPRWRSVSPLIAAAGRWGARRTVLRQETRPLTRETRLLGQETSRLVFNVVKHLTT